MNRPLVVNAAAFQGGLRGRLDHSLAMRMAADAGFEGIELLFCESGSPSFESGPQTLKEIARLSKTVLPVRGLATLLNWKYPLASVDCHLRERGRRLLRSMITAAHALECPSVSISAGDLVIPGRRKIETVGKPVAMELAVTEFRAQAKFAEELGVRLLLENVLSGFIETPHEMASLVRQIGMPNVLVCLDIGNARKLEAAEKWIAVLVDRIHKVHVTDYQPGLDKVVPPGQGSVDWNAVRKALSSLPQEIPLVSEHYFAPDQPPLAQLETLHHQILQCLQPPRVSAS